MVKTERRPTLVLALAIATRAAALDIVVDGRATTTIVVPDEATKVVVLAADELQLHVRLATGAELPIVPESRKPRDDSAYTIYMNQCYDCQRSRVMTSEGPVEVDPEVVERVKGDAEIITVTPEEEAEPEKKEEKEEKEEKYFLF